MSWGATICVGIIFLACVALGLWGCLYYFPEKYVPLKRAYDRIITVDCYLFSGEIFVGECNTATCYGINATMILYLEDLNQTVTEPYHYYSLYNNAQEEIEKIPYIGRCEVNTCHSDYQGSKPEECYPVDLPLIMTNLQYYDPISSLITGIFIILPMALIFIAVMIVGVMSCRQLFSRRGYVGIN
jgi:hypothetical protein